MTEPRIGRVGEPSVATKLLLDAILAIKACTGRGERAHEIAVAALKSLGLAVPEND